MDAERLRSELEGQGKYCEGKSPVYQALCAALARDLRSGKTQWPSRLFDSWKGRSFTTWYEAPLVLLNSIHLQVLKQDPTLPGLAPKAVLPWLEAAPPAFWEGLKGRYLQTNEAGRAPGWMLPATVAFLGQRLPFHLVDMGTSAGLTLIGDYLDRDWVLQNPLGEAVPPPERFDSMPYPILSRSGLDRRPLRLADREDRLWLKACIWPDDAARHLRFEKTVELFLQLSKDSGGPKLFGCAFAEMPAWVAAHIPPHPEEGLLLYNSQAADFLTDAEYAGFKAGILETLRPWGERGLWVELEMPRGVKDAFHELRAHRMRDGKLETGVLGTATAHPKEFRLQSGGWDILVPRRVVQPRITIEESPKEMKPGLYKFPIR